MSGGPTERPLIERALEKVDMDPHGCWLWTGARNAEGYGLIRVGGRDEGVLRAHRVIYEALVGPILDGLTLDHLCRNRACVRPSHVEAVTVGENVMRGTSFAATNAAKTHCSRGHEYTPLNTYRDSRGWRRCRQCTLERGRRQRARGAVST